MVGTRIQTFRNMEIRKAIVDVADAHFPITAGSVYRRMHKRELPDGRSANGILRCLRTLVTDGALSAREDGKFEIICPELVLTARERLRFRKPLIVSEPGAPSARPKRVAQSSFIRPLTPKELMQGRARPARCIADG